MRFWNKYSRIMQLKSTPLCVGLDTALEMLPAMLRERTNTDSLITDALVEFNRCIIEATHDVVAAYKLNLAFYEQYGASGWLAFEKTLACIPDDCLIIADAKRGDIGNTSKAYAKAFFERYSCDALTVAPYMGKDSLVPFLEYTDNMTFVLALTSNAGSADFQRLSATNKSMHEKQPEAAQELYKHVIQSSLSWLPMPSARNCGFVVGATHPAELAAIRAMIPNEMLLIPGIGAQGGDLAATLRANNGAPCLINSSRAIIYASSGNDFAEAARKAAESFLNG
ncbi:MAG: orotidine-5'-phosphate decarboxylase [Candidatus Kapaibacterium sp.]|nr:MAG: orotidine-5'-phosphate decarboxylase [Candidatus Kapabacteria bacterium]